MAEGLQSSRQARHLVRRLLRDCDLAWPGGEDNAAIVVDRRQGRFSLRTIDGRPAPALSGSTPLARLLRDGFLMVRWKAGEQRIELHHVEESLDQILARAPSCCLEQKDKDDAAI